MERRQRARSLQSAWLGWRCHARVLAESRVVAERLRGKANVGCMRAVFYGWQAVREESREQRSALKRCIVSKRVAAQRLWNVYADEMDEAATAVRYFAAGVP
jgi:hypothetical protein